MLFLRKGRIAKMMIFAMKIDDFRRPARPGNSKNEKKKTLAEFSVFSVTQKRRRDAIFDDFWVLFGAHFWIFFPKKHVFLQACFFFNFVMFFWGVGGGGEAQGPFHHALLP